jgi:NAD(P)-dependent dehydrogenase (short-subunit alcohol dehydrogenase family)
MKTLAELGNLSGQVALITGGAGHVGRTVAAALAELGCDICLLDLEGSNVVEEASKISSNWGVKAVPLNVNLESELERSEIRAFVEEELGRLDILINNAAFYPAPGLDGWATSFEEQKIEVVRRCIEVNLTSGFHLSQQLIELLRKENGRIINIGSIYGVLGPDYSLYTGTEMSNPAAYAMSKGGLVQLTRWLATTLAPEVRVNCLCLGGVARSQPKVFVERYNERTPLRRMATEEDFKGAAAFLASNLSAYVTGQVIMIDGGWTSW